MRLIIFVVICLIPVFSQGQNVKSFERSEDRIDIILSDGTLSIYPIADNAIRIKFYKEVKIQLPELIFTSANSTKRFQVFNSDSNIKVICKNIIAELDKQTGGLSFIDNSGKIFLKEKTGTRKLMPDSVMGEPYFKAEQAFESPNDEHIFGLGQFQDGHYNLRNITRRLTQVNSQISIPFIYSSNGYGLLWHQYGLTDFNPTDNFVKLEKQEFPPSHINQLVKITIASGTQEVSRDQSLYSGKFKVPSDGEYSIFLDLGNMDNRQYIVIDGRECIDITNFWLPPTANTLMHLSAGEHLLQLICKSSNTPKVSWKLTDNFITFRSPNAKLLDYVVLYGPSADSVIAVYRKLSGKVPMLPLWAYGFWQCRERYKTSVDLVETVREFRKRNLPMDVIVQDWQYWGDNGWGVPQFDSINYPNPASFIKEIHDLHAHFNISIWSNPDKNSILGNSYALKNLYIPNTNWLDYFNPITRELYWNTLNKNLFSYGVDSWWMDATEPENDALHNQITYLGPGDFYRLTYPLYVSKAVYEGQRKSSLDKRVCILTRSAFAGQQRYGTINWSGDIAGNWDSFKRQIVAGLNYTITGMPYWTTDIGGFFRPGESQYTDENYQELLTRWFQWGAFNPIFRIHGYQSETEPWKYGQKVEDNMKKILNLRYRLLPYIYSEAWKVTEKNSTIMRPLIMDFSGDTSSLSQQYEYMFGKAFLIAPVTEPNVSSWDVYLPKSTAWYNFWTGIRFNGGQTINIDVTLDKIPLFIKAGSIIPMGPITQYSSEKNDPIEIRIYPGADCDFTLYEDENDNYNYEKGIYSTIVFNWEDEKKVLTIKERKGSFPSMHIQHKFNIVIVSQYNVYGIDTVIVCDREVNYDQSG